VPINPCCQSKLGARVTRVSLVCRSMHNSRHITVDLVSLLVAVSEKMQRFCCIGKDLLKSTKLVLSTKGLRLAEVGGTTSDVCASEFVFVVFVSAWQGASPVPGEQWHSPVAGCSAATRTYARTSDLVGTIPHSQRHRTLPCR